MGGGTGFPDKTVQRLAIVDQIVGDEFERDMAAEAGIFRVVNQPHAATAEFPHDVIVGD